MLVQQIHVTLYAADADVWFGAELICRCRTLNHCMRIRVDAADSVLQQHTNFDSVRASPQVKQHDTNASYLTVWLQDAAVQMHPTAAVNSASVSTY